GHTGDFVIHIRCKRLAVIGDEVLVNPVRVVPLDTQLSELPLGFVHEVLGFGECGSGGSLRLKNNGGSETEYCECDEHLHIVSEFSVADDHNCRATREPQIMHYRNGIVQTEAVYLS